MLANKLGRTGAANFVHLLVSNKLFLDLLSVCSNLQGDFFDWSLQNFLVQNPFIISGTRRNSGPVYMGSGTLPNLGGTSQKNHPVLKTTKNH